MDENMEDDVMEESFECFEVDLDYEFDAFRYFDFYKGESPAEVRQAELWFATARSYPPSPYVMKLNLGDILVGNVNTIPKSKDEDHTNSINTHSDAGEGTQLSSQDKSLRGRMHDADEDIPKDKRKPVIKASLSRGSTLMKPTASQLAKQNRPRDMKGFSQFIQGFQKPLVQKSEQRLEIPSRSENQAAKRQKLEGGHLRKVLEITQQTNLMHKTPKKNAAADCYSEHSRLKLTIPKEPELKTAQRAQRMRPKTAMKLQEYVPPARPIFKARPLNRKILEAPLLPLPQKSAPQSPEFQEFHLKTSERAMQHLSTAASSLFPCSNSDKIPITSTLHVRQTQKSSFINEVGAAYSKKSKHQTVLPPQPPKAEVIDDPKQEGCKTVPKFKARPLNKKIFSSKGDIGVFRTSKRETTTPIEFNFSTDKRFQHNPPIELFNKLSLTSGLQQNTTSQRNHRATKDLKENIADSLQEGNLSSVTYLDNGKIQRVGEEKTQCGVGGMTDIRFRANIFRLQS